MKINPLSTLITQHKQTGQGGVVSVCSAHPEVLQAAAQSASEHGALLLIEATSNQVDQFGGYTGLTPAEFISQTRERIKRTGFPMEKLLFGGDHLGPNAWQDKPAEEAMLLAEELIRQYACAGFSKIHLDCSMSCADDPVPLDDTTVATRAARLCKIAETVSQKSKFAGQIVYIIGTEVPVPGGAQEDIAGITPTSPVAAQTTYDIHRKIFTEQGLTEVWSRVIGLVVQPGVEFDHHQVIDYQPALARDLVAQQAQFEHALYEAHSTDYQSTPALAQLVKDHFAILKVGPALTFAYREAVFALNRALLAVKHDCGIDIEAHLEQAMLDAPARWQKYYEGNAQEQALLRKYSLSDRSRYYWAQPDLQVAIGKLYQAFDNAKIPYGVLHQYLPQALEACHNIGETFTAQNLIQRHIGFALTPYYQAIH